VWIRSPDSKYWVYSLSSPTQVTLKCRTTGPPQDYEPNQEKLLYGTGILPNSSDCYIYSETFKLLPHSLGRTPVGLNKAHLLLPSIGNILKTDEQVLLQEHSDDLTTLRTADTIIRRATERVRQTWTRCGRNLSCLTTCPTWRN
jgi:hypothetical protein